MQPLAPSRLAIHTQTHKPWSLAECVDAFAAAGVGGISVWRHTLEEEGVARAARRIRDAGLWVPALVRGGFFCGRDAAVRAAAFERPAS